MSLSVAPNAVRKGSQSVTVAAAMGLGPHARCTPWFVPIAVSKPKYLLNHVVTSRFIAVIASIK